MKRSAALQRDPQPPDPTEPKFSMAQVAKMVGVHISTISRHMDERKLGYYQIGTRRIVGQSHLQTYLSLAQRQATARAID